MLFFEQPTQKTYDYVLVAHQVDDERDQKAQRQRAFIQKLEEKNITVKVSLPPLRIAYHYLRLLPKVTYIHSTP